LPMNRSTASSTSKSSAVLYFRGASFIEIKIIVILG
jgi:hypothetical protein